MTDVRCDEPDEEFEEEYEDKCNDCWHGSEDGDSALVMFWVGFWLFAITCALLFSGFAADFGDRLIDLLRALLTGR